MKKPVLLLSAAVLTMSAVVSDPAVAATEKCFGIAEAGKNEGTLRLGNKKSTKDYMIADWIMVEDCADEHGILEAEATEIFKKHGDMTIDDAEDKGLVHFDDEDDNLLTKTLDDALPSTTTTQLDLDSDHEDDEHDEDDEDDSDEEGVVANKELDN